MRAPFFASLPLLLVLAVCPFAGCFREPETQPLTKQEIDPKAREAELKAAELDPAKQESIWEGEHVTFELEHRFGKPLRDAIVAADVKRVAAFFREDATGAVLGQTKSERTKANVREWTRDGTSTPSMQVEPADVAARLIEPFQVFREVERTKFRVLQIRQKAPEQWWIRALLAGYGQTADGVGEVTSEHEITVTIREDEAVGKEPLVNDWQVLSETARFSDAILMQEVTENVGLDRIDVPDNWRVSVDRTQPYRFQAAVADFNQDGYLDIAIAVVDGWPTLLQSVNGKSFRNVTSQVGLRPPRPLENFVAAWIDYDNDGDPDLLIGDRLYRNEDGKKFVDVTVKAGLFFRKECLGCTIADYDGDGRLDIYALYQRNWTGGAQMPQKWVDENDSGKENHLWRNVGGRFQNVTDVANAGGGKRHTHAAAWFFYDDDHHPDLYIANDFGRNSILRNQGNGSFEDVSDQTYASDFATSMGVVAGDLNNDGKSDIYVANMFSKMGRRIIGQLSNADYPPGIFPQIEGSCAGNRLYSRGKGGQFEELSEAAGVSAVGWAFGPAMADFDNDGWLDLYSTSGFMSFKRGKPDG